jgi:hypothetical protein
MAYTIKYTPVQYSSLQDQLFYTVAEPTKTADPVTYPDYKFIGDVYVDGVMVARIKKVPDPVTGFGVFNIFQTARAYLATVFDPTFGQIRAQQLGDITFFLTITMKFGEEYGGTEFPNVVVDTSRIFFNSINGHGGPYNPSLFFVQNMVASNRPLTGQARLTERFNLLPYFPTSTSAISITVTPVGGGIVYSTTVTPGAAYSMQILNFAPANLNALQAGTITASTQYYNVTIGSQTFKFNMICEALYTPRMIHFLNRYGGFESKSFNKVSRYQVNTTKNDYGRLPFTIDPSTGTITPSSTNKVYLESRPVYALTYTEKRIFNSDILTDDEWSWLTDLIISPMIYNEELNNDLFPVVLNNTNYETIQFVNDGEPQNLQLELQYGGTLNSQYR